MKLHAPDRTRFFLTKSNPPLGVSQNPKAEIMFFRLMSGHTNTNTHWYEIGIKKERENCRFCHIEADTEEHILLNCTILWPHGKTNALRYKLEHENKTLREAINDPERRFDKELIRTLEKLAEWGVVL